LTHSKKDVWKVWVAAGLWLAIIVVESSNFGSSGNTSRILYPIFHFFFGFNYQQFEPWHHLIRKCGHFVGYFTLSVLLFRAWRETLSTASNTRWMFNWAGIAWVMTTLVACLDEWHQAYIPTRGSSIYDVLLDSSAALAAQIIIWLWLRRRREEPGFRYA
jgi:VanZ family protein